MTLGYESLKDALDSLRHHDKADTMAFEGPYRIFVSSSQYREIQNPSNGFKALRLYLRDRRRVKMLGHAEQAFSLGMHLAGSEHRRERLQKVHSGINDELARRGYVSTIFGILRKR